ncbi:MAG: hypothetical protein H7Y13_04180 [Sphingobacteriaceae bacterium]|nr:hypothetical protein [Sphingobacteriaceae bacterium]
MNYQYLFTSIFLLAFSTLCHSQSQTTETYIGVIDVEKVGQFNLQLTFKADGHLIEGHSITNAGNKNETKAYLTGKIYAENIEFSETNILRTSVKDKSTSFCFVNAKLTKRTKLGLELLEGTFKGKDKNGSICGSGTIHLVKKVTRIPDSLKNFISKALKDTAAFTPPKNEPIKTLSTISLNKIQCGTNTVKLRIYDSGAIDGDVISMRYNEITLYSEHSLTKSGIGQFLTIEKQQDNILELKTLNEGANPPNTATIDITTAPGKIETYRFFAPANSTIALQFVLSERKN